MATLDKETLKSRFADGEKPTGEDFSDLIDTIRSGAAEGGTSTLPVSDAVSAEGTNTTGFVSPSGVKAHVDGRRATHAEAHEGADHRKLMTPLRVKQAITFQVTPGIAEVKDSLLDGVATTYNTLRKLYDYITSKFYSRTDSDRLFDKKTDRIAGGRIASGINAAHISSGRLSADRLPNTHFQFRGAPLTNWTGDDTGNERSGPYMGGSTLSFRFRTIRLKLRRVDANGNDRPLSAAHAFQYKVIILQQDGTTTSLHSVIGDFVKVAGSIAYFYKTAGVGAAISPSGHDARTNSEVTLTEVLDYYINPGLTPEVPTLANLGGRLEIHVIDQNPSRDAESINRLEIRLSGDAGGPVPNQPSHQVFITLDRYTYVNEPS